MGKGHALTIWKGLDQEFIYYVNSFPKVGQGLRSFSALHEISIHAVRNHWYSHKLKVMRGEIVEDVDISNVIEVKKTSDVVEVKPRYSGRKLGSKNKPKSIDRVLQKVKSDIIEDAKEIIEENKNDAQFTPIQMNENQELVNAFIPFAMNNQITKEAKEAISDIQDSLVFFTDGFNKLIKSNSDLVKENEETKFEYNRLLRNYKELEESYTYMLRLLNKARVQALQEDDQNHSISNVSMAKTTLFNHQIG